MALPKPFKVADPRRRARTPDALRHLQAGDRHRDAAEWTLAAQEYRAGLEIDPGRFGYWVQLGNVSKEAGDFAGAERAYARALAIDAADVDLHIQLGHLAKRMGDGNAAQRHYQDAARLGAAKVPDFWRLPLPRGKRGGS